MTTSLKEEFIAHVGENTISCYGVTHTMKERTTAPRFLSPSISQVHVGFSPTSRKHLGQQCTFTFSKMEVSSPHVDRLSEKDYANWPYLGHNMSSGLWCLLVRSMWYVDRRPPGGWEARQSGLVRLHDQKEEKGVLRTQPTGITQSLKAITLHKHFVQWNVIH